MADGRWQPRDESDIQARIDEGLLGETQHLEVKREVTATDGGRKELARDLVSFAIHGGMLLIGVEEHKEVRTWSLHPVPLAGLAERVEQVAQSLVDPPLHVVPREIGSEHADLGYLAIEIPPSATAPHMVGGVYYGRAERTKTRLSDAEVGRLHRGRENQSEIAERLLRDEIHRDPVRLPSRPAATSI